MKLVSMMGLRRLRLKEHQEKGTLCSSSPRYSETSCLATISLLSFVQRLLHLRIVGRSATYQLFKLDESRLAFRELSSVDGFFRGCLPRLSHTHTHTHIYTRMHTHAHACTHRMLRRLTSRRRVWHAPPQTIFFLLCYTCKASTIFWICGR